MRSGSAAVEPACTSPPDDSSAHGMRDVEVSDDRTASPNLVAFSHANCLFWYFQGQGWDTDGIRGIAGGFVEKGTHAAETYAEIAEFIRGYRPPLQTKEDVDIRLLRCFHLNDSAESRALTRN